MKLKRIAAITLAASMAAGLMTGCSGGKTAGAKDSPVELNIAIPLAEEEWQVF